MMEIENEVESTESGAQEGSSPEASESNSNGGEVAQAAAPKQEQQETTPFHEHPRFKELVEQKNEALRQYQAMQAQFKTLESQLTSLKQSQPKPASETDELLADLQKVDPRLANVIKTQLEAAEQAKALQSRLEQFENQSKEQAQRQTIQTAVAKINSLHETGKMSDFGKQFINNALDIAYRSGKLDASDLKAVESAYQEVAKAIKAHEDSLSRSVTEKYVQEKKKDASVPVSQPKGAPAKQTQQKLSVPQDKEALKAAVVQSFMKEQAARREATNA